MKIENGDRAIKALEELKQFKTNLKILKEMREKIERWESGILFQQYSDGSGLCTDHCFTDGNYNTDMNLEIINHIILVHVSYMDQLEQEILSL
jgi:hypothetical protein